MKKEYVNMEVQVVDIQLSDCIAGSNTQVKIQAGSSEVDEVDGTESGSFTKFSPWE